MFFRKYLLQYRMLQRNVKTITQIQLLCLATNWDIVINRWSCNIFRTRGKRLCYSFFSQIVILAAKSIWKSGYALADSVNSCQLRDRIIRFLTGTVFRNPNNLYMCRSAKPCLFWICFQIHSKFIIKDASFFFKVPIDDCHVRHCRPLHTFSYADKYNNNFLHNIIRCYCSFQNIVILEEDSLEVQPGMTWHVKYLNYANICGLFYVLLYGSPHWNVGCN